MVEHIDHLSRETTSSPTLRHHYVITPDVTTVNKTFALSSIIIIIIIIIVVFVFVIVFASLPYRILGLHVSPLGFSTVEESGM